MELSPIASNDNGQQYSDLFSHDYQIKQYHEHNRIVSQHKDLDVEIIDRDLKVSTTDSSLDNSKKTTLCKLLTGSSLLPKISEYSLRIVLIVAPGFYSNDDIKNALKEFALRYGIRQEFALLQDFGTYGSQVVSDQDGRLRYESWLRLLGKFYTPCPQVTKSFDWINPYFFLRHQGPGGPIEFFCLGVHPDLGSILKRAISTQASAALLLEDPYALYYCVFSYWNTMCLDVFWRLAEEIWEMEHGSFMLSTSPGEIYRQRHEIARHVIQLTDEVAPISYDIFCALTDDHKTNPYSTKVDSSGYKQTKQGFEDLRLRFKSFIHHSRVMEKRLSNQIQLAYNLVALAGTEAVKDDSVAMRTISVVTLIFLPITAIATVFSTPFFSSEPSNEPRVSVTNDFWVFWSISLPITVVTFVSWAIWKRLARTHARPFSGELPV